MFVITTMQTRFRSWLPLVITLVVALAVVLLPVQPPAAAPPAFAADEASDWESIAVAGAVRRLYAPASGALFALTDSELYRSDDAGTTWQTIPLPPPRVKPSNPFSPPRPSVRRVAVDSTDDAVLYASGEKGLYRTGDSGVTWHLVLPTDSRVRQAQLSTDPHFEVEAVAVSPADPRLLYAGLSKGETRFQFLRSRDAGTTWEQLDEQYRDMCIWFVWVLMPHPTDQDRLFRTAACYAGRHSGEPLDESRDRGATWTRRFGPSQRDDPQTAFPEQLVGGRGKLPERYYLAAQRDVRFGGSSLFSSDDDGRAGPRCWPFAAAGRTWTTASRTYTSAG